MACGNRFLTVLFQMAVKFGMEQNRLFKNRRIVERMITAAFPKYKGSSFFTELVCLPDPPLPQPIVYIMNQARKAEGSEGGQEGGQEGIVKKKRKRNGTGHSAAASAEEETVDEHEKGKEKEKRPYKRRREAKPRPPRNGTTRSGARTKYKEPEPETRRPEQDSNA